MIIKNHICTLLAFFILLSQTGTAVAVYFCNATVASITIIAANNIKKTNESCCVVNEKKSKCCDNKISKSSKKLETTY